jgi:hypothetical protein
MKTETVFLGRDNSVDLLLKADGVAADLSSVTKITASFKGTLISSENSTAGVIRWGGAGFDTGEIQLHLGGQSIPVGKYSVPIVVYDAANANGIQWTVSSTEFGVPMLVKADQEAGA